MSNTINNNDHFGRNMQRLLLQRAYENEKSSIVHNRTLTGILIPTQGNPRIIKFVESNTHNIINCDPEFIDQETLKYEDDECDFYICVYTTFDNDNDDDDEKEKDINKLANMLLFNRDEDPVIGPMIMYSTTKKLTLDHFKNICKIASEFDYDLYQESCTCDYKKYNEYIRKMNAKFAKECPK